MSEDVRSGPNEETDESPPTDEEQTELEWHFWLFALLLIAGGLLIAFPPDFWPEIGLALVAFAVVGWSVKTVIEWTE